MAKNPKVLHTVRNVLVILSFLLMIAVVVFQWCEIQKFEIQDHMGETLKSLFVSAEAPAPAPVAASEGAPVAP